MGNANSPGSKKERMAAARALMPSVKDAAGVQTERALRFGRSEAGRHGAVVGVFYDRRPQGSVVVCSEFTIELFNTISGDRRLRKTPDGSGIISCADFRQEDNKYGTPVLVYGTRTGFVYFLDLEDLSPLKAMKIEVKKNDGGGGRAQRSNTADELTGDIPLQTRGGTASDSGQEGAARGGKLSWRRVRSDRGISYVKFISESNVLVGTDDGTVHDISLQYGGTTELYSSPKDGQFERSPVLGAIPVGDSSLVVGHENGDIHVYSRKNIESATVRNGKWQQKLPNLSATSMDAIVGLGTFNSFCTFDSSNHKTRIYMLTERSARELNFESVMSSLKLPESYPTCGFYDDERGVLFTGHMDGSFLLRKVTKNPNNGLVGMKLMRVGQAAHKMQTVPSAPTNQRRDTDAIPPTCITALRYDSIEDQLLCGDFQGISRIKLEVTGQKAKPKPKTKKQVVRELASTTIVDTQVKNMTLEETQAAADKIIAEMSETAPAAAEETGGGEGNEIIPMI